MKTISESTLIEVKRALLFRRITVEQYVRDARVNPAFPTELADWGAKLAAIDAAIAEMGRM